MQGVANAQVAIMAGVAMLSGAGGRRTLIPIPSSPGPAHEDGGTPTSDADADEAAAPLLPDYGTGPEDEPTTPKDVVSWVDGWASASHRSPTLGMWPCMGVSVVTP